ncbi:MAG: 2-phospho-L-lactate guanylyltransferase [Xanthomonadales bacterium]|nr:2-phospho-L-lactate guanylyltransferase [Xanthomonadales bacterium]
MSQNWALVPLNNLDQAKSRLGPALDCAGRRALVLAMAEDALSALVEVDSIERILLVSNEPEAGTLLRDWPIEVFYSADHEGLNLELVQAAAYAATQGADRILIVHADLPWLTPETLVRFVTDCPPGVLRAAQCKLGVGTNALLTPLPLPLPLVFGPESLQRFTEGAAARGLDLHIVTDRRLSFDIDSPEDLQQLLEASPSNPAPATRTARVLEHIHYFAPIARTEQRIDREA